MSAHDIIADYLSRTDWKGPHTTATSIIITLEDAGYLILGPDEVDAVTLEKAAEVAANWGSVIPAVIRALGRKA